MVRWSGLSEKQTHRKLSGSVGLGQFSTQSGRFQNTRKLISGALKILLEKNMEFNYGY
jgi:hypothetical protein